MPFDGTNYGKSTGRPADYDNVEALNRASVNTEPEFDEDDPLDLKSADDFYGWEPLERQKDFLGIPDTIRESLYGGAASGGKTDVLLMYPVVKRWIEHPKFKGIILRRTHPELEQEIVPRSEEYYKPLGGRYIESKKIWIFPSGARIRFGHAEHEKDIVKYDGGQLCYVAFDELTHFTEAQYLYLVGSRLRSPDPKRIPAVARSATNPGNIGHKWVYERFVKPAEDGYAILVDKRNKNNKRIFIPAKLADNKHADPNYINTLDLLPEAERKAKKDGSWHSFEGQVFAFRPEGPLPAEPENANHVIEPFDIPFFWPKIITVDWGFRAKTVIHWSAIAPTGRVYIYREYAKSGQEIAYWSQYLVEQSERDENIKLIRIDPSAKKNSGSETIFDQFARHIGSKYSRILDTADNDRVSGKTLLQDFLRWTSKPVSQNHIGEYDPALADRLMRNYGRDKYLEYISMFKPAVPEHNLPKLQIFNTCTDLIETIPHCVYDKSNKEDVATFEGDDSYDNVRYTCKAAVYYEKEALRSGMEHDELEVLRAKLASVNNQTSLYRIAEKTEARRNKIFAVRMYRRRR